jgi:hypothetical protein
MLQKLRCLQKQSSQQGNGGRPTTTGISVTPGTIAVAQTPETEGNSITVEKPITAGMTVTAGQQ